jgi:hypothetical protein
MKKEQVQELVRELIRKYVADDGLRPEYDGMSAWSLAGHIMDSIHFAEMPQEPAESDSINYLLAH